jgi:hypothetical protein
MNRFCRACANARGHLQNWVLVIEAGSPCVVPAAACYEDASTAIAEAIGIPLLASEGHEK